MLAASEAGATVMRGAALPPEQVKRRRRTALELGLGRNLHLGYHGPRWTEEDVALPGVLRDGEVARKTGRSVNAVRQKRERLGRPNPSPAAQARAPARPWTRAEDRVVLRLPPRQAAGRLGRTPAAVTARRFVLRQRGLRPVPVPPGTRPRER
jgi:hypothetical protein